VGRGEDLHWRTIEEARWVPSRNHILSGMMTLVGFYFKVSFSGNCGKTGYVKGPRLFPND
jgi:hypothetical protein